MELYQCNNGTIEQLHNGTEINGTMEHGTMEQWNNGSMEQ